MFDIPKKYYDQEGFFSLMGIGYTAALATIVLGVANFSLAKRELTNTFIIGGGVIATYGYLRASGVIY